MHKTSIPAPPPRVLADAGTHPSTPPHIIPNTAERSRGILSPFAPHPFLQKSQKQKRIPKTPRSTPDLPEKPHIGSQERVVLKAKSIAIESPKRTQNPLRFPQTNPHLATPLRPKGYGMLAVLTAGWYNTPCLCQGCRGRLAQWLERLVHTEEVVGSNPSPPTTQTRQWGRGGGMADALRSGRSVLTGVWVQIPPSAPRCIKRL